MANPGGANQLGGYELQPAYGDVKRMTQLQRSAPMSGAPIAGSALNTPRRAQRGTARPRAPRAAAPTPLPPEAPQQPPEQIYRAIAQLPGASETVQRIFGG